MGTRVLLVVGMVAGGAGRHVHELCAGLRDRDCAVTVACPDEVEERYGFSETGAVVHRVDISDRPHPLTDARTMRMLRTLAREHDVVHAHGLRAGAMTGLAAQHGVPVVVTLHNAAPTASAARVIFQALERVVAHRATTVLVVSPDLETRLAELGADDVRPAVVAAAPPPPPNRPASVVRRELGDPESLALVVGRLAPQKDLDLLLDALSRLPASERPSVVVAGEGPLHEHLEARIVSEGLPVQLLGHRSDVPDLLAAADLVISSAAWEGQPVWLQEALQAGLPVVATDVGGTRTVVGRAALLVPHGDPGALAAGIARLAADASYRKTLAGQAISRAAELPDRDDAVNAVLRVYADLADTH